MAMKMVLAVAVATLAAGPAAAQSSDKLAFLIPTLYGPTGLVVDSEARLPSGETHSAHFNSAFQAEFTQFNVALASQLAAVPLPSSASGFTYELDPTLGVFQRSTRASAPSWPSARKRSARGSSRSASATSSSPSTRWRA